MESSTEEECEEEVYSVKDHELFSGVADFYNNSKLSDINLSVGTQTLADAVECRILPFANSNGEGRGCYVICIRD